MNKIIIPLTFFICIALVGCKTTEQTITKQNVEEEVTVETPFDNVWANLIAGIKEKGFEVSAMNKRSGMVFIDDELNKEEVAKYSSDRYRSVPWPVGPMGGHYGSGNLSATIRVKPVDEKSTHVAIKTEIKGKVYTCFNKPLLFEDPHDIKSNGTFEKEIISFVSPRSD